MLELGVQYHHSESVASSQKFPLHLLFKDVDRFPWAVFHEVVENLAFFLWPLKKDLSEFLKDGNTNF